MNGLIALPRAQLDLGFVRRGDRTILDRRHFSWPFVLTRTFRLDPVPSHMLTVIVQTSSSAIHGDDRLTQRFVLGEGSAAHLTTQGATAVHRAHPGMVAGELVQVEVAEGAFLEYLPEPRILFPGAALKQALDVRIAPGAIAIVSDAFTFHDPDNSGHIFRQIDSTMQIRTFDGDSILVDRLNLTGRLLGSVAQFGAFGSIVLAAARPAGVLRAGALELSESLGSVPGLYAAATPLPGDAGIGVRLAGRDARSLRAGLDMVWVSFRRKLFGQPPSSRRKSEAQPHG